MNAQLEIDFTAPRARTTDPKPAHDAAKRTDSVNAKTIKAIRDYVRVHGPATRFQIADALMGRLGVQHDTIRSACSRASMTVLDENGRSPGGRACERYIIDRAETRPL